MPYDKTKPYACPCCGYWNGDMRYDYYKDRSLIKDEEVRELVRKWAKINCLKIVKSYGHEAWVGLCGDDEKDRGVWSIELRSEYLSELEPNREYTITELCGEEGE